MRASVWLLVGLGCTATVTGAGPAPTTGPEELEAFGSLVAGTWQAPDSRHVFEWGLERRVLRSRSYFPDAAGWRQVSEGLWFWDRQEGLIRGTVVTDRMPFHRMEYRSRVDGDRVVHRLRTFGAAARQYVETWTFTGDGYRWELEEVRGETLEPLMSGSYRRVVPR